MSVDAAIKRLLDVLLAGATLFAFLPVLMVLAAAIRLDSPGPALFTSVRIGRAGRPFRLYKLRTMVADAPRLSDVVSTPDDDPRITRVGRWLRRYNLDEIPQCVNVLRGEMSLVGPRPEVPRYVALYTGEERRVILSVRPGFTDLASIWIRDKGRILEGSADPERMYMERIRPEKLRRQMDYVRTRSLGLDVWLILVTLKTHVLDRVLGAKAQESRQGGTE